MTVLTEPQVRTEIQVAADTVAALVVAGIIKEHNKDRAGEVVGLMPGEVGAALNRRRAHGFVAPRRNPVPVTVDEVIAPHDAGWSPQARANWQAGSRRGAVKGGAARSRQPKPGQKTMHCPLCGNDLEIKEHFALRSDRPGKRWTTCNGCRHTRSRDRYLDVGKERALNMARLTFVICEDDERIGLGCVDCGELLRAGDDVTGAAQLTHVVCPKQRVSDG